jgi:amidase
VRPPDRWCAPGRSAPKELCAQAAQAVTRIDPQIEAVLGLYDDVVADPDANRPTREGLLYGVPILLKDLGSGLAGRAQESGSKLHTVEATDPLVDNYLRASGLIPIGRSTTPEFGMPFDTATDYLGRVKATRNAWKLERTPGGSSGGSAAAVAAGILPIGMSSDGGGSTRIFAVDDDPVVAGEHPGEALAVTLRQQLPQPPFPLPASPAPILSSLVPAWPA